jgi:hypothetical protein
MSLIALILSQPHPQYKSLPELQWLLQSCSNKKRKKKKKKKKKSKLEFKIIDEA